MSKRVSILAMVATAVFGVSASGTVLALPEVDVGSRLLGETSGSAQAQSVDQIDAVAADEDSVTDDNTQATSN